MPAQLDDPHAPAPNRRSGPPPYPRNPSSHPPSITPKRLTLRDNTTATLLPFTSPSSLPRSLLQHLCDLLNREIERGDTYPMLDAFTLSDFATYWFGVFGTALVRGAEDEAAKAVREALEREDGGDGGAPDTHGWDGVCLGSFYIKPNYPGRSSHVCNAGFLVGEAARGKGAGRAMGEAYVEWAGRLGYSYSVFNLVYETNVASCRIWDALGFQKIGRVPGCGNLKPYPGRLVDSIVYGREVGRREGVDTRVDK